MNIQSGTKMNPLLELALGGGSLGYKQQVLQNMQTREHLHHMEIQMKELSKEQAKSKPEKDDSAKHGEAKAVNGDGDEVVISEAALQEYSSHAATSAESPSAESSSGAAQSSTKQSSE
ncbi:hypothetical protein [Paenibacillus sp. 1001270B_150601_E10]|uniref:hypothetical protein n=1 Tax=Paenibacillus sp. 1001270B_150601_E10 TaxID=2787079 RepID=UPI00189DFD17|nr:hypothetical protein [Paenibacillus sp. 1001270B_150601_E10]